MSTEKMQILKMLENGQINSGEAAKLLQAIDGTASNSRSNSSDKYKSTKSYTSNSNNNDRGNDIKFDDFANDLSRKFEVFARDMEPRLQKLTETVVEKTANMADKLSKSISESATRSGYDKGTGASQRPPGRNFDMIVLPGYNELNLTGLNGDIYVKGYNGDKLSVKIFAKPKRQGSRIELLKLGNKYYLDYDEDEFEKVLVDALVPESLFKNITIRTLNGAMNISTLNAEYFEAQGANGGCEIKNVHAENINIESTNSKMVLSAISAKNAKIENLNGPVQAQLIDISNMKLESSNGQVGISVADFNKFYDYMWVVETSNAKLSLNLPSLPELGYYLKAHTSLGNIRVGLTGMGFSQNDSATIEARSVNYDSAAKHIKLSLETSNAALNIN